MKYLDKVIQPIKNYLSQFKKEKKSQFKLQRKLSSKKVFKWIIWSVLILFLLIMILSIYKANVAYQAYKQNGDVDSKLKSAQAKESNSLKNDPKTKTFTEKYIDEYMNIPNDDDGRTDREDSLSKMSGQGMEYDQMKWDGKRELKSKQYFDSKMRGDTLINQYIVDYTSESEEEKPKEVKKKVKDGKKTKTVKETKTVKDKKHKDNKMIINVALKGGDGNYKVVETPYFTNVPKLNDKKVSATKNNMENSTSIHSKSIEDFTTDFFKDYTSKSTDDMKYLMEHPESVKGQMEFDSIKNMDIYKHKGNYIVKTTVMLKDEGVNNPHEENFTLDIKKDNDNYKVTKLNHTIGKED